MNNKVTSESSSEGCTDIDSDHVLNNFRLWVEQGYPTETRPDTSPRPSPSTYPTPSIYPDMVIHFGGMKEIVKDYGTKGSEGVQILDARSPGRFAGKDPEPRAGLSSGYMSGSINVPLSETLDPKTKAFCRWKSCGRSLKAEEWIRQRKLLQRVGRV